MFKVGDWVTQSDEYYRLWGKNTTFHLKIKKIIDDVIFLDGEILLSQSTYHGNKPRKINSLHKDYLKLDTQHMRKLKLRILNDKSRK